jgi:predicted phosphohydrolase
MEKTPKMSSLEEVLLNILQEHKGKDNPITVRELERMNLSSSRKIRKAIANLVIHHNIPIASSVNYPYGFYLITDKDEALQCLKQYWSRVKEVSNRAKILSKAVENKFGINSQKEFKFEKNRQA